MSDLRKEEAPRNTPDDSRQAPEPAVTLRALTTGTVLTIAATLAGSYARFILHTTRLDQNHLSMAAVFPLVRIVIFCMPLIGATMPTYFIGKLIANITAPHYLASPENQWTSYFGNHLPAWAVMPEGRALRWFYEGLPRGASIPWTVWVVPVFWWITGKPSTASSAAVST